MSKGKAKVFYEHSAGSVGVSDAPIWDFLYRTSTVRDEKYNIGDRVVLPDGRVFRYAKALDALKSYHGCGASLAAVLGYTAPAASQVVGDTEVVATLAGRVKDDLRGAYIIMYDPTDIDNSQNRGIIGNDASLAAGTTKIYLDGSLTHVVTSGAGGLEIFANPYKSVTHVASTTKSCIGIPAVSAAAGAYVWIQTWGPCIVSPGEDIDDPAANARELVFGANYVLFLRATHTSGQLAGFYLNSGGAAIPGPAIMLQISP